jgi:diaminohydroxyphosphoribosylaminopyrimidine deaminase/5-amino-6-(5-phosphoribosylamino)uracil reductase
MSNEMNDQFYMDLALQLAEKTNGQTGVNPAVGCVLVKQGRIVGVGAHLQRGHHHAEIHALQMAGSDAFGSTAYVTLEPCNHFGVTPPCTDALIAAGVAKVVIAVVDVNPQVAGSGIAKLRAAGIEVVSGVLADRAHLLNESFFKYIQTGLPFVAVKIASTLDGRLATKIGDSRWISGEASRALVHQLRHQYDGIMVGIGTVLADDPSLTARADVELLQPARIIVDSQLRVPLDAKSIQLNNSSDRVIILTTKHGDSQKLHQLTARGIQVIICGEGMRVDLQFALKKLAELHIRSVLLEGGGELNGAMLEQHLLDKAYMFIAPKLIGGSNATANFSFPGRERMEDAIVLKRVTYQTIGDDVLVTGYFPKEEE